ncbi:MAG: hypothetical protein HC938_17220 [Nitrospira sp.]|nr:hypothetical protein [Nitrospira sp.]
MLVVRISPVIASMATSRVQPKVATAIDFAHAALSDEIGDDVVTENGAGRKMHRRQFYLMRRMNFAEARRVLKPGGHMVLECPNLATACEEFLANQEAGSRADMAGQRTMWVFYGDPRWQDPFMVHRWGYTPKSLATLMAQCGLINARQEPAQFKLREPRDMRVVADKPA